MKLDHCQRTDRGAVELAGHKFDLNPSSLRMMFCLHGRLQAGKAGVLLCSWRATALMLTNSFQSEKLEMLVMTWLDPDLLPFCPLR